MPRIWGSVSWQTWFLLPYERCRLNTLRCDCVRGREAYRWKGYGRVVSQAVVKLKPPLGSLWDLPLCAVSHDSSVSPSVSRERTSEKRGAPSAASLENTTGASRGSEVSLPVSSPCRVIIGSPLSLFPFVTGASQCKSMSLQCSSYIMRERQKRKEAALTHVVYCSVSVLKISLQRDLGHFWKYTHTHISRLHVWIFSSCLYRSY